MEVKRKRKGRIVYSILYLMLIFTWFVLTMILASQNRELKKQASFEPVKQGLCVYVEYDINYYNKREYNYCLVYDEYIDQIIEVDLFDEVIYCNINAGDTIVYVVDYDYTDADFLNVIKGA